MLQFFDTLLERPDTALDLGLDPDFVVEHPLTEPLGQYQQREEECGSHDGEDSDRQDVPPALHPFFSKSTLGAVLAPSSALKNSRGFTLAHMLAMPPEIETKSSFSAWTALL